MLCFCDMYFVFGCAKKLEPYYFFVSFHTNSAKTHSTSGLATRYKIFDANAHKEIIRF